MPLDQDDYEDEELFEDEASSRERHLARMPLGEHLEELRHRLILALIGPLVAVVFTLAIGWTLVYWITRPLLQVQQILNMPPQTYAFGVTTGFGVYLKVSLVAAIIIAFPWLCYQLWKFIESGLYPHERKGIVLVLPFSAVMSVLGVLFLYYLLLPVCLAFMLFFNSSFPAADLTEQSSGGWLETFVQITVSSYGMDSSTVTDDESAAGQGDEPSKAAADKQLVVPRLTNNPEDPVDGQVWRTNGELRMYNNGRVDRYMPMQSNSMLGTLMDIKQYLSFVTLLALGVVIAFQLPVVLLILGWTGLVSPHWLAHYRKHCVLACFGVGAIFTPADPMSMLVLALPLWGLFELGLLLMRLTYKAPEPID